MALDEYRRKRDFSRTAEPAGDPAAATAGGGIFVVQKHAARRLHYDFRLEMDGVMKSWAVTKGPSCHPADKRLAVHVEDHPLEYADFEGNIPKGQYGGGTVMVWDRGQWYPQGDAREGYRQGRLKFTLDGSKLHGGWALIRMHGEGGKNWLLIKERDDWAGDQDVTATQPLSVISGRDLDEIASAADGRVWHSNRDRFDPATLPGARQAGLPAADALAPQLATLAPEAPAGAEWLHEIKFDGYRVLARSEGGRARLYSRNGKDWTDKFGPLARAVAEVAETALLDGEVVVLDAHGASSFQALQEAIGAGRVETMNYFVFDLLHLDGWDLAEVPLERRKQALKAILPADEAGPLRFSDHFDGRGPDFRRQACSFALEGVVSKRRDRPYRPGRGRDWLKAKCTNRQEFVIAGYTPPAGASRGLGALLLGYHDGGELRYAGKVGTGFSEATIADLVARLEPLHRAAAPVTGPIKEKRVTWVEPQLVAEVEFTEWTRDGLLRHPSFQGLRLDKGAAEVVREVTVPGAYRSPELQAKLDAAQLSNPDRILYPRQGITKHGLAGYYLDVARWMLPHVARRPLTMVRCPQGSEKHCFYWKHAQGGLPAGLFQVDIREKDGTQPYLYLDDVDGLIGLVQLGVLEIHLWGCRIEAVERPDRVVFDLDPDPAVPWPRVAAAARELRQRLAELGLRSFLKTTGGKGLHLVVPLAPEHDWDTVKAFTKAVAADLAARHPDRYTANMAKAKRVGRIYVDYLRNQRGATFIAPFSTRAKPGAPVSVPLAWEELDAGIRSDHFTVDNVLRRLASLGADPWEDLDGLRQSITPEAREAVGLKP